MLVNYCIHLLVAIRVEVQIIYDSLVYIVQYFFFPSCSVILLIYCHISCL